MTITARRYGRKPARRRTAALRRACRITSRNFAPTSPPAWATWAATAWRCTSRSRPDLAIGSNPEIVGKAGAGRGRPESRPGVAGRLTADAEALLVSASDKLHNARAIVTDLRALGPAMFSRFTGGMAGTLWYYGALSEVFARRLPGPLADDLAAAVHEMQDLARERSAA